MYPVTACNPTRMSVTGRGPGYPAGMETIEETTYTDMTMAKVADALRATGLTEQQIIDAISLMQNAGILFRERV